MGRRERFGRFAVMEGEIRTGGRLYDGKKWGEVGPPDGPVGIGVLTSSARAVVDGTNAGRSWTRGGGRKEGRKEGGEGAGRERS